LEKREEGNMEVKRRPYQGVLNIIDFNRHFYYYGIAALVLILCLANFLAFPAIFEVLIISGFSYGLLMPLIVSAYVYDFSDYYSLDWLDNYLDDHSRRMNIVNINAGFDETSFTIKSKLKKAELEVFDFYDEENHTEPAIVRARKVSLTYPGTKQISSNKIPIRDASVDIVFLLSSAHEIRDFDEKVAFLKECKRICNSTGRVIMVEHLRDLPNFVAFTIGFAHFFSKSVWQDAFTKAGFRNFTEEKFTPFMSIFESKL